MKLVPSRNALGLLALWLALGVTAAFIANALIVWQTAGAAIAALLAADAVLGWHMAEPPMVERRIAHNLAVGRWSTVTLRLTQAPFTVRAWLQDAYPAAFEASGLPLRFTLLPGQAVTLTYRVRALVRGSHRFAAVTLRADTPLKLWQRVLACDAPYEVRVYPDFAKVTQYAVLATDHRLSQIGVLQRRRRGEGLDFHQLRDYRDGDSSRQIDWKATARARKLVSREYQDERDQRIVFMLDCGQRMRAHEAADGAEERALSHFDHTLNALLLLAYVALRQGDAVGVLTFGHPQPRYLQPRKSVATVNAILNGLYDLQPTTAIADYLGASEQLHGRLSKRALVVMLTNLRDEDGALLMPALRLLRRRHLVLIANLREPSLEQLLRQAPRRYDDALAYASATEYMSGRTAAIARLRQEGASILDAYPLELPRQLVNHYWELKRAGEI